MTDEVALNYFTGAINNAQAKAAHDDGVAIRREQPWGGPEQSLTLSSGSITPAAGAAQAITLLNEGAAATDDLTNMVLTNVPEGRIVTLRAENAPTQIPRVQHGIGGSGQYLLRDGVDYVLDDSNKRLALQRVGTDLLEAWRSHAKIFESSGLTLATNTTTAYSHLLGGEPDAIEEVLECVTADLGYSVGDRVRPRLTPENVIFWADATEINVLTRASGYATPQILNKTTRLIGTITPASWDYKVRAWRV